MKSALANLVVVLVSTRNPLNIGAAARAMSNFGFSDLRVVDPYDVAFREARSAVGAADLLATAKDFTNLADALADCGLVVGTTAATNRELQQPLKPLPAAGEEIRGLLPNTKIALLFGSEKRGLANEDLAHCHWALRIPARTEHASMNLGQAVAICLYEIARFAPVEIVGGATDTPATSGELERLTTILFEALATSGYVKPRTSAATEEKLRRMVRRLSLNKEDAEALTGMVRKMLWKMNA